MAGSIAQLISRGLTRLQTLQDSPTFGFEGVDIPCVVNSLMRGVGIEVGGKSLEILITLFVLIEDMPAAPLETKRVTLNGAEYRVLSSKLVAASSHWEIHLGDPDSAKGYFPSH